jgi:hypothetical protein
LNCIALLGSVTLPGVAVLVPFRPHVAAKVGVAGSLLSWVSHAPLITASFFTPFSTWLAIREFISFRDYVPVVGMLVGSILLVTCAVNSALFFRRDQESSKAISR